MYIHCSTSSRRWSGLTATPTSIISNQSPSVEGQAKTLDPDREDTTVLDVLLRASVFEGCPREFSLGKMSAMHDGGELKQKPTTAPCPNVVATAGPSKETYEHPPD